MTWIAFDDAGASASGKTRVWRVSARSSGDHLGAIHWHAQWRRYAFWPDASTMFDEVCLRDIAAFCGTQTTKHQRARKEARTA